MKLCVITAPQNKGWILDRLGKEVGLRFQGDVMHYYGTTNIPKADTYFVNHYSMVPMVFGTVNSDRKIVAYFTHESINVGDFKTFLNKCVKVITASFQQKKLLVSRGINDDLISVIPEGADPDVFKPHKRSDQDILFTGKNYPRKNPKVLEEIIKLMPQRRFKVVGAGWDHLSHLENVTLYKDLPYNKYPEVYSTCDVVLSCSTLEGGGPNGVIEAMHSNLVPVVSDTGNAREYIVSGQNGIILPITASPGDYVKAINAAYSIDQDIRSTVEFNTWRNVANEICSYL